jgi:hypothetical protein
MRHLYGTLVCHSVPVGNLWFTVFAALAYIIIFWRRSLLSKKSSTNPIRTRINLPRWRHELKNSTKFGKKPSRTPESGRRESRSSIRKSRTFKATRSVNQSFLGLKSNCVKSSVSQPKSFRDPFFYRKPIIFG